MPKNVLTDDAFAEAEYYLLHSSRALERNGYKHYFNSQKCEKTLFELKNYQNSDGGFGHGLEPDFRLPLSSPLATTVAFQHLNQLDREDEYEEMIRDGIRYFEESFDVKKGRWLAAPADINDYPHAPWWHYSDENGGTPIDKYWGNPTAEILAYMLKYREYVNSLNVDELVDIAIERFVDKNKFESEHEVYCYLKLYQQLPEEEAKKITVPLRNAIKCLACTNPCEWGRYVPKPLDFIKDPDESNFGIDEDILEDNLNFIVDRVTEDGALKPTWEWGQYDSEWERAKDEWTGWLTLRGLITLDKFGRIDM